MLNKIKLKISKIMTQKKIIIGILCSLFLINTSFHSSLIHAATTNNDSFEWSYGEIEMSSYTFDSLTNIVVDGTTFRSSGVIYIDVYMPVYRSGTIKLLFSPSLSLSSLIGNGTFVVEGGIFTEFNTSESTNAYIYINVSNVNHVRIIYTSNDTSVNTYINNASHSTIGFSGISLIPSSGSVESTVSDIDIKLSNANTTLQQILALIGSSGDTSITDYLSDIEAYLYSIDSYNLTINNSLSSLIDLLNDFYDKNSNDISEFKMWINYNMSGYTSSYYSVDDLNDYIYSIDNLSVDIVRIMTEFNTSSVFNGNYAIFQFYIRSSSSISEDNIKSMTIGIRDRTNNSRNLKTFYIYDYSPLNTLKLISVYIPTGEMIEMASGNYQLDFRNITFAGVTNISFAYMGCVDNLPSEMPLNADNQTSQNIVDVANDIADTSSDINDVEEQYINDLNDFKNNLDLSDYNFNLTNRTGFEYLREKLTDIYEINEFKPFYLVPIIFFVLTIVLGG